MSIFVLFELRYKCGNVGPAIWFSRSGLPSYTDLVSEREPD